MADKTIGSLTKVTSLQSGDAFVMERNSAAVQTDAKTIKEYVLSGAEALNVLPGDALVMKRGEAFIITDARTTKAYMLDGEKVTGIQNSDAFLLERDGEPVKSDAETIKDYVFEGVSGNVVINGNLTTMTADKTSSDVLSALQAGNNVEMHLHGSDENDYRSAEFVKIEYSADNEEFIAYFAKHVDTMNGGMKTVVFTLGDDGRISEDSDIGVNSVNGQTGDVQLAVGVSSVNGMDGDVTVREVPNFSEAFVGSTLVKTANNTIEWSDPRTPPTPATLSELQQWLETTPELFEDHFYNTLVEAHYWDEDAYGDQDYFYRGIINAVRSKHLPRIGDTQAGMVPISNENGEWSAQVFSTEAARYAPVKSVNGKTGVVVLKTSDITNDSGYIRASQAPVQDVNGQTGHVTVNEVPDYSGIANGRILTRTTNGVEWKPNNPLGVALLLQYDSGTGDAMPSIAGLDNANAIIVAFTESRIGSVTFEDLVDGKVYNLYEKGSNYIVFARPESNGIRTVTLTGNGNGSFPFDTIPYSAT